MIIYRFKRGIFFWGMYRKKGLAHLRIFILRYTNVLIIIIIIIIIILWA